ncbi:hypothetical protein B0T16DRAFT_220738 [Cercophora newfieldiana]|uniref:Uncharacterized protein n=1 Tax=Cercophora newfieldiana TaxID=92897 RepID=A0AA40CKI8_9PEZI|nr:hypothetical protein B0T16DRAFT_220738 [Cercophora newfieldiana]
MENAQCHSTPYTTTGEIRHLDRLELYETEKPYEVTFDPIHVAQPDARRTNLSKHPWPVEIRDFSSDRTTFNTDVQGFELERFPTTLSAEELQDVVTVEARYYGEAEAFLKLKFGAKKVFIFDTTIRESRVASRDTMAVLRNTQKMRPASDCHVDQSPGSVRRRVLHNFPNEGESLLKDHRVRVINIWRPLVWPYHSNPLAVCDWRSTTPADYTLADHFTPVWEGESLQVYHSPQHRWWFAKQMNPDDVLLLKMYDSEAERLGSGIAMCESWIICNLERCTVSSTDASDAGYLGTPHCSFEWKGANVELSPRVSMEIRAIVFS